ncbi:hypothetical protein [uncultured Microscilla sp.]|uniref:hypothetical protein n=1 Tax=uncultured Microscilla sp. TaxID=432653 RepID=UPI0026099737|nr:hypothetical protein [uncultured Microscilla sp.]
MNSLPFTLSTYSKTLETALNSGYEFTSFDDHKNEKSLVCLLRHDIDVDLEAAFEMAKVEAKLGIKSTYFLMLRSPVYNLFSRHNQVFVQKIIDMGHFIGLHYDEGFQGGDHLDLENWIDFEAKVIEQNFNVKIEVVSFHQPSHRILNNEIKLSNFINTYDKEQLAHFHYISDSNKVWKEQHPLNIFKEKTYSKLHLLIHPMWWFTPQDLSTEIIWDNSIRRNLQNAQLQILNTERAYGQARDFIIVQKESKNA